MLVAPAIVSELSVTAVELVTLEPGVEEVGVEEVGVELVVEEAGVELASLEGVVVPHAANTSANAVSGSHFVILFIIFLLS